MSTTTTFTVRPATLRDAKSIAELHNATVCEAFKSAVPNDCGGTMRQDCVRNATNAPLAPATVNNPVRTGTSPRKVVRGGAFCSTNARPRPR